ncbi:MAG: 30S ribosomal protein S12 methylthiotransferase RimO, partial [Gammaproteobacteria bacterium]
YGRSHADAPEIDGRVTIRNACGLQIGDRLRVRVDSADTYDLTGSPAP